jgi:hypothetical protein
MIISAVVIDYRATDVTTPYCPALFTRLVFQTIPQE